MRTEFVALALSFIAGSTISGLPSPAFPAFRPGYSPEMRARPQGKMAPPAATKIPSDFSPPGDRNPPENDCEKLLNVRRSIFYLNTRSYKMSLQLRGIYTRGGALFFCLRLCNHSHIDYGVDSIRFCMADDQQLKKAPAGGTAIVPLSTCGNTRLIRGKTAELCIFALPRFTLPGRKRLLIEVSEKNGGRRLRLLTDNYTLVRARSI